MLTKHRLRQDLWIINPGLKLLFAFRFECLEKLLLFRAGRIIAVDAQPMHFAATFDLILPDNRYVVFALTSQHARRASDAEVQIDRHSPLMNALFLEFIERIWI